MHALKHYVHTMTLIKTLRAVYIHHLQAATHLMDLLKNKNTRLYLFEAEPVPYAYYS